MRTHFLFALAFSSAACGSVTVIPAPVDVPPGSDANVPPGSDASVPPAPDATPPRSDGSVPPTSDVPTPPPMSDGGVPPIRDLCARLCDDAARRCGAATSSCVNDCSSIERAPGVAMCATQIQNAFTCFGRYGFSCTTGGFGVPMQCRTAVQDVTTCLGSTEPPPTDDGGVEPPPPPPPPDDSGVEPPPPPPPPDDGGVVSIYRPCADACALADRTCARATPECPTQCSQAYEMLGGDCRTLFDEFLTCVLRNGFVCSGGSAQPASACATYRDRINACLMGGSMGGSGGGTVDAGTPDV